MNAPDFIAPSPYLEISRLRVGPNENVLLAAQRTDHRHQAGSTL
jgi:hypothetical protein